MNFIDRAVEDESSNSNVYDPNQGTRIIHRDITEEDVNRFFSIFLGRTDVYSKRVVKKSTGEVSYYTQCHNFWKNGCPRIKRSKIKCQDCEMQAYKKLEKPQIMAHLRGNAYDGTDVIGIYPRLADATCNFIVFDFDYHGKGAEKLDFANADDAWKEEADALRTICEINGIDALVERSRSGKGAHVWIFFEQPIGAFLAREFGKALLEKGAESVNLKSFRYYDALLPGQSHLQKGELGSLIPLPLQGQALKQGNSAFVDENWNAYPDQWEILFSKTKLTKEFVEQKIREWTNRDPYNMSEVKAKKDDADSDNYFCNQDVDGTLHITLEDAIYIDTSNLQPRIQNQIRRLAAFDNPVFYKNQAIGLSNFATSRFVYLGRDEKGFLTIPRGLLDDMIKECDEAGIEYRVEDRRSEGKSINVEFNGELKETQVPAVDMLMEHENGILNAATAFGKTVVCCNIIAQKKVSTLILLQSSALLEQWKNALEQFLVIDEEPPEYETPSGRKRKRQSVIGKLQGAHDSTTGIIDIAMVGSVCKKGEYHKRLKEYGLVLVDECHHAASDTIVDVLQEVNAKYVYGVTATPLRGDGLEKINYMLLGPIRYRFTSKDRAKEQGIDHLVYPRFTRTAPPALPSGKVNPNDVYEAVRDNEERDNLILSDVESCIEAGRTPVILSKYVDHSNKLYERLKAYADNVFLLSGDNSKKENQAVLEQMSRVKAAESMILVATGQLIGEGFDFPRLDTLIMATPVAWKGVVEQYAGRLNRDYDGKESVIIYDYIDCYIPMFDRMYFKRLKAYKQIGYNIYTEQESGDQKGKAIFDVKDYYEIYKKDLQEAKEKIIISSSTISGPRIGQMMPLFKEKMEAGVQIEVITWKPECYGFGDISYWKKLHEQLRRCGLGLKLVEDYCGRYCIIDQKIVWYGSMNFLGKENDDDSLMRVCSKNMAEELLKLTFE